MQNGIPMQRHFDERMDTGAWRTIVEPKTGYDARLNRLKPRLAVRSCSPGTSRQRYLWQGGTRNASRNACQTVAQYC